MISRNIVTDILFIAMLVVLQVFIFNRIVIMDKYVPVLYLIFVMFYPFNRDRFQFLGLSFLLGVSIDMFAGTWGINACATVLVAYVRIQIFKTASDLDSDFFSFESLQWIQFLGFIFMNVLVHQLLVQMIEYFKFSRLLEIMIDVLMTSLLSFVFIVFYVLIFKIKPPV